MKNRTIYVTIFLFLAPFNLAISQNCKNDKNVPKEFYRSGYYESNMNAGFPYTMFNKNRTPNFHWTNDVITIRLVSTLAGSIPYKHKLKSV